MPCDGGKCIPITFRCDKFSDCNDGADEMHCGKRTLENHYIAEFYVLARVREARVREARVREARVRDAPATK